MDELKMEELEKKILEIVTAGLNNWAKEDITVKVKINAEEMIITVTNMYEYVDITFDHLEAISKLLKTENINIGTKDYESGCDTCDYGSEYWIDLHVRGWSVE